MNYFILHHDGCAAKGKMHDPEIPARHF